MSRIDIDHFPVVTLTLAHATKSWSLDDAHTLRRELLEMVQRHLRTEFSYPERLEIESNLQIESRCNHCNATWTEVSHHYNGGCCDADQEAFEASQVPA